MLMDCAREFRSLRAPQGDGETLVDPAYDLLADVVAQNCERLAACNYEFHGRSLTDLSHAARHNLLKAAIVYTSQYRDIPAGWEELDSLSNLPFILSGHQPELFHPGVWYKNFVLGGLARRLGGVGIHLLIDSDLCRTATVRVPTGTLTQPRVEAAAYDAPAPEVPYEERAIQDTATFSNFAERAAALLRPLVANPMVVELWPIMLDQLAGQKNLGLRLAQGRHAFEQTWNIDTLELPQSAVCQMPEFAWFVAHILADLPRFRTAHNEALACYRSAHHLRNRAQPVPDLMAVDDWIEAPFWIWTSDDPQRRPLYARRSGQRLFISDRRAHTFDLAVAADGDLSAAVEQLIALPSQGIKLRTRALTTTLFARLVLSDLFLHGIGGAKYDQVTDQIVRLYFGFEPPELAAVSATLRLPLHCAVHTSAIPGQWEQRLRELQYHPEHFIELNGNAHHADAAAIIAAKQSWLRAPKTFENARERHRAISDANLKLQPFVEPLRRQIEQEIFETRQRRRDEAILRSREYSFCLYPREHFDRLLSEPRL